MREMQVLLLELRPMALDDVGLPAALAEICRPTVTAWESTCKPRSIRWSSRRRLSMPCCE
jgi:signal transduction histidine kinase